MLSAGITKHFWRENPASAAQLNTKEDSKAGTERPGDIPNHHGGGDKHNHMKHRMSETQKPALGPAEGASVNILSPKEGSAFKGDKVPVHFKFIKGKKGHHIHAYVDGALMGMFETEKGTLTGIQPGHHVLEVRVVAKDHVTELDATDAVHFVVK